MDSTTLRQEDRQHERKGILFAVIFHGLLLLVFFFWIVLEKSNSGEGTGEAGVPINFGFDEMGSGDNNSMDQVATQTEQIPQEAQQPADPSTDDASLTSPDPNAETVIDDTKKPSAATPATPTTKPTQQTTPTTNPNAKMGDTNKPGVNGGDGNTNKPGNQGDPNGSLNSNNYNGKLGDGGDGTALSMDGWHLVKEPEVENPKRERGNVVFTVTIDGTGTVIGVVVKNKTISDPALIKKCENEIWNDMEFEKNKNNAKTATTSTGTITFVFRVN